MKYFFFSFRAVVCAASVLLAGALIWGLSGTVCGQTLEEAEETRIEADLENVSEEAGLDEAQVEAPAEVLAETPTETPTEVLAEAPEGTALEEVSRLGSSPMDARGTQLEFFSQELPLPETGIDSEAAPGTEGKALEGTETEDGAEESESAEDSLELRTIQDFWKYYEVSDSLRDRYADGQDWQDGEENLLFFYHLQERIRQERLEEWALPDTALEQLDSLGHSELNARRFDAFWINGRLLSAEKTELEESIAFRYRVGSYFTCRVELNDGRKVTLFCQTIPRALLKPGALESRPRIGCIALFLKKGNSVENVTAAEKVESEEEKVSEGGGTSENVSGQVNGQGETKDAGELGESEERVLSSLFMLTRRLAWYPDTLLGNAGMDCGLLDELDSAELPPSAVRSRLADTRLTLRNRECFYQMMASVFRMGPEKLDKIVADVQENAPDEHFEQIVYANQEEAKDGKKPVRYSSVVPLFREPLKVRGDFFYLKGIARRIVPIRVEDADINQRFGITHYYEVFLFPDEVPETPIVVLVPELPQGVQPGSDLGYYVELAVPAFFFNTWSYEKGKNEEGKPIHRLAPLLIGGLPARTVSTVFIPELSWFYVLGLTVFGSLFIFSIAVFLISKREEEMFARNRQKMFALPEGSRFENEVEKLPEEKREIGFEEWVRGKTEE